ncbi:MAG: ABC transporter permease, partial [Longimicrobiales bacterium]
MSLVEGLRTRLRLLFARRAAEDRMEEEFRFHVEMEAERLVREAGLDPREARRRALVAFGGQEQYREELREERGFARLTGASLDLKLGLRMLIKYPGLTVVGGLGMAVAIAIGVIYFDVTSSLLEATLPFEEGERIVAVELWDTEGNEAERQIRIEFETWRETLRSIEDLAAYRSTAHNLIVPGGTVQPVVVAEMTASGFRSTRVPPLLGRTLVEDDERAGAPPVAVIGYGVWRTRFGGDADVLGREVRLGNTVHTVVGVMPEGFAFPVRHELWVPLRAEPLDYRRGEGPGIEDHLSMAQREALVVVFGRLAEGATFEEAQAELTTVGLRVAGAFPAANETLRPRVVAYTRQGLDDNDVWAFRSAQLLIVLLLGVICVNVAVLIYARTLTRVGEITVRTALGASRRRIVAQLFAEALVLSLSAAAVGLAAGEGVLRWLERMLTEQSDQFPFWLDFGLSPDTILYALALAVLAAAILGVVPALKATGRGLRSGLSALGGSTGVRLGKTWTALIVAQVAVAVAILPAGLFNAWDWSRYGLVRPAFPADEYLTAGLVPERERAAGEATAALESAFADRYGDRLGELERRLEAEPHVADVAFVHRVP